MDIADIHSWADTQRPVVIAGPCSAESYSQLYGTAMALKKTGVKIVRAGVWKPRTRPDSFEGAGDEALKWIQDVKDETGQMIATEVATPGHVEKAINAGIDVVWVGARTTVNPIMVQEIANALKGVHIPVLVKNPINPEISLWMGALERFNRAGITSLAAVHRGFSSLQKSKFRNPPSWHLAIELKSEVPEVPMLCDPSHICGNTELIPITCQKAMDLDYDGLMVEVHVDPKSALSDSRQQITPKQFSELMMHLQFRDRKSDNVQFLSRLEALREKIDHIDRELIETLSARMKLVDEIGEYKKENNVTIFQLERWREIITSRPEWGSELNLDNEFVKELYQKIHDESIRSQTNIMSDKTPQTPQTPQTPKTSKTSQKT